MKRILILGINGFMGQHLARSMPVDVQVVGYGRHEPAEGLCCAFVKGNFVYEKNWEMILKRYDVDTIYHFISSTTPNEETGGIESEITENVLPTIRLLEAMKTTGVQRIIFASSGGTVYGEGQKLPHKVTDRLQPICGYGMQKITIESYLQFYQEMFGLHCIVARIANPYGLMPQNERSQGIIPIFLRNLLLERPITLYGETVRDYIYIEDAIEVLVKLGQYTGAVSVFNVGTGIGTGLRHLVSILEKTAEKKFVQIIEKPHRACDVQENVLDVSETERVLHWRSKLRIEQGVKKTLDAMCACSTSSCNILSAKETIYR